MRAKKIARLQWYVCPMKSSRTYITIEIGRYCIDKVETSCVHSVWRIL